MKKNIIYILLIVLITQSNCRKFKDDPFISLKTVKTRMKGEWRVTSVRLNNEEVLHLYNDSLYTGAADEVNTYIEFNYEPQPNAGKSSSYYEKYNLFICNVSKITQPFMGVQLRFVIDKNKLSFDTLKVNLKGRFVLWFLKNPNFEITKLYKNEFILKNETHEIIFKRK